MKRLTALLATAALLGSLLGARAVAGPEAVPHARSAGVREADPLHGGFWRPAGSDAERPAVSLVRASWSPSGSVQARPEPGALAAVRAVVRLAALD
jgi:hypothetical protein